IFVATLISFRLIFFTIEMDDSAVTNGNQDPSQLESKIIRQIEYYFGDHNLARDKFLKEQVKLDDGWIPLDVMVKFNRLKSLSTDIEVIVSALKKSQANLIEIHEDSKKIRRSAEKPLPENNEEYKQEVVAKSIYAKGFPEDATLDQILEFFKGKAEVENIIMRRMDNKKFKGSIFATFKTKEEAEEFSKKEGVKYKDQDLLLEMRPDYHKRKSECHAKSKTEAKQKKSKDKHEKQEKGDDKKAEGDYKKNTVLKIIDMSDTTTREHIKAIFSPFSEVAWVDSNRGDTESYVRFKEENGAKEALEKVKEANDGKVTINEKDVEVSVLEGEDEEKFWKKAKEAMVIGRNQKRSRSGGHKRKGKGYQGNRGRAGSRKSPRLSQSGGDDEEPST
ncbi:SSB (predicted), partial [Pycnogonum litorale]